MAEPSPLPGRRPVVFWVMAGLWCLTLLVMTPLINSDDQVLFALVVMVLPGLVLGALLISVPVWALLSGLSRLFRGGFRSGLARLAILPTGVLMAWAGGLAGDLWMIHTVSQRLEAAVEQAKSGIPSEKPIEATANGAYVETGGFFDLAQGIAYDPSDKIEAMLALAPDQRPREWLEQMPLAFSCAGAARHLGGHYWRTNLDRYNCLD